MGRLRIAGNILEENIEYLYHENVAPKDQEKFSKKMMYHHTATSAIA